MIWKYFYSTRSVRDKGTLYNIRNRLNRSNLPADVTKDFNSCDDFIEIVTKSYGMESVSDSLPTLPADFLTKPDDYRKSYLETLCGNLYDQFISLSYNSASNKFVYNKDDDVSGYAIQLLRICSLYLEFSDAIREGDGLRVLRCWRYLIPIFRESHSINYSIEAVEIVHQYMYALSPQLAKQLIWGRFVNVHGVPGSNISLDLHMEHLNRIVLLKMH